MIRGTSLAKSLCAQFEAAYRHNAARAGGRGQTIRHRTQVEAWADHYRRYHNPDAVPTGLRDAVTLYLLEETLCTRRTRREEYLSSSVPSSRV